MKPDLSRYKSILKRRRYPIWSVRTVVVYIAMIVGISSLVAGFIPDLNIFARMELALGICALAIFWLMALGLYRGARVRKKDLPPMRFENLWSADDAAQASPDLSPGVELVDVGDEAGCLGMILGLLVSMVMLVAGGLVIWALIQLGGWLIVGFIFGLSWVVSRALRQVFARSRQCQGELAPSLAWTMVYTTLYTLWLFALLVVGSWLNSHR